MLWSRDLEFWDFCKDSCRPSSLKLEESCMLFEKLIQQISVKILRFLNVFAVRGPQQNFYPVCKGAKGERGLMCIFGLFKQTQQCQTDLFCFGSCGKEPTIAIRGAMTS